MENWIMVGALSLAVIAVSVLVAAVVSSVAIFLACRDLRRLAASSGQALDDSRRWLEEWRGAPAVTIAAALLQALRRQPRG